MTIKESGAATRGNQITGEIGGMRAHYFLSDSGLAGTGPTLESVTDDNIDLLADMLKHWARNRAKGLTPIHIRAAIFMQMQHISDIAQQEPKS